MNGKRAARVSCFIVITAILGGLGCRHGLLFQGPKDATTPLRVRGGAMTFRHDTAWGIDSSDNRSACIAVDTTNGATVEVNEDPGNTAANTPIPLSTGWAVDLHGRLSDFKPDQSNGIRLQSTNTCKIGNKTKIGITLTPLVPTGSGGAYLNPDSLDDNIQNMGFSKRYQNSNCDDDEDACEHMSTIHIVPATAAASTDFELAPGKRLSYRAVVIGKRRL